MDAAPLTLLRAVQVAVEACDPSREDTGLGELLLRFEDRDEPIGDPEEAERVIAEELGALDPQAEDPALQMAAATATYLAYRRDEAGEQPGKLLRLAARAEYDGHPPDAIRAWLQEGGVEL